MISHSRIAELQRLLADLDGHDEAIELREADGDMVHFNESESRATACEELREQLHMNAAELLDTAAAALGDAGGLIRSFVETILHGDETHRAWLRDAAERFIEGAPVPAVPRAKGED